MHTINGHSNISKRKLIAEETRQFLVPLAEKLGSQTTAQEFKRRCEEVFQTKAWHSGSILNQ